jgi:mono/diheme cytochrome c family protein
VTSIAADVDGQERIVRSCKAVSGHRRGECCFAAWRFGPPGWSLICAPVFRRKPLWAAVVVAVAALAVSACGTKKINADNNNPTSAVHEGAVLFHDRCGGCHTLSAAATQGAAVNVSQKERTDGPNLDFRHESVQDVLFAIRNGGFSGSIMPANVVVGPDQQKVAEFVSKYAGSKAASAK